MLLLLVVIIDHGRSVPLSTALVLLNSRMYDSFKSYLIDRLTKALEHFLHIPRLKNETLDLVFITVGFFIKFAFDHQYR